MQRAHEPTEKTRLEVRVYSAAGTPQEVIANLIGISLPTLHKYYRSELDDGMGAANALVARSLFAKAQGKGAGAVTAAIFWLKARAGWKDTHAIEHSGAITLTHEDALAALEQAGADDGAGTGLTH